MEKQKNRVHRLDYAAMNIYYIVSLQKSSYPLPVSRLTSLTLLRPGRTPPCVPGKIPRCHRSLSAPFGPGAQFVRSSQVERRLGSSVGLFSATLKSHKYSHTLCSSKCLFTDASRNTAEEKKKHKVAKHCGRPYNTATQAVPSVSVRVAPGHSNPCQLPEGSVVQPKDVPGNCGHYWLSTLLADRSEAAPRWSPVASLIAPGAFARFSKSDVMSPRRARAVLSAGSPVDLANQHTSTRWGGGSQSSR